MQGQCIRFVHYCLLHCPLLVPKLLCMLLYLLLLLLRLLLHFDEWQHEKPAVRQAHTINVQLSLGHIDPTPEQWAATPIAPEPTAEVRLV